jgi:hypothetical protein
MTNMTNQSDDSYDSEVLEDHFHTKERWFGKLNPQTATDWAEGASLNPYVAISGNGVYGAGANDEALVLGVDDSSTADGMYIDVHRIFISSTTSITDWVLRMIWGTGTMAAAIAAGQYSEFMFDIAAASRSTPVDVKMPRIPVDTKVWLQGKNATDDATVSFMVGVHFYQD